MYNYLVVVSELSHTDYVLIYVCLYVSLYIVSTTTDGYDTDKMGPEFCMQFVPSQLTLTVGQSIVFQFQDKKKLMLLVKEIEGVPFCTLYVEKCTACRCTLSTP